MGKSAGILVPVKHLPDPTRPVPASTGRVGYTRGYGYTRRPLPTITAHAQNHGVHGDRDSVIFLQPRSCLVHGRQTPHSLHVHVRPTESLLQSHLRRVTLKTVGALEQATNRKTQQGSHKPQTPPPVLPPGKFN